jgi:hypothetical protein
MVTEEEYNIAKTILKKEEYVNAKNIVERYEYEQEYIKKETQKKAKKECNKGNKCNWVVNESSPPYERTFYCTKCGLQEDGWGEQW